MLVNNGQIIADGFGQPRSIDLTEFSTVTNTIENEPDGTNGWYATRGGRVELPALPVKAGTSTLTWGEAAKDSKLDLVNSLRATVHDQSKATRLSFVLHDATTAGTLGASVPRGITLISLWSLNAADFNPSAIDIVVRYDHVAAERVYAGEYSTQLFGYRQAAWQVARLSAVNVNDHLMMGSFSGSVNYLAVGVVWNGGYSVSAGKLLDTGPRAGITPGALPSTV